MTVNGDNDAPLEVPVQASNEAVPGDDAGLDGDLLPDPQDGDAGTPGKPRPEDEADAADKTACAVSAERWLEIAITNCAPCHGENSPRRAGFSSVLDVDQLVASGKVVPGQPDGSPLYLKLSSGQMPPPARAQRPSEPDIETVRTWIACGAPAPERASCEGDCTTFLGVDARLDLMLKDTLALATPEERADVRYLDLSNYANAGQGDDSLELYRSALSYLVNSLSNGPRVVVPQVVDQQGLVFRVRLSDYGWTSATWERIVADYPYAVSYDANSRGFPYNEPLAAALRSRTGTAVPYVQADWFLAHASRPPLYYDVLGIPATFLELQTQLGIDVQANITALSAARAGFTNSGPSRFNRVIERHSLGDERGALWLTYDFSAGSGNSNVLTRPLDFTATSSEILFNLKNGMQAYMITDGQGLRLDKAPSDAVQDPRSQDLAIEGGISCISCHTDAGILAHDDEVRATTPLSTTSLTDLEKILALYVEKSALDAFAAADRGRYQEARRATRSRGFNDGTVHALNDAYLGLLQLADVAGVLGISEAQLAAAIDATPRIFPPEVVALRTPTSGLARDAFDAVFAELVTALNLGQLTPR